MAASGLIRRSEPQPTAQVRTWPRTAAILDEDGQPLTSVDVLGPPRDGRLQFGDVREPAALLDQYFGRGAEIVMVKP